MKIFYVKQISFFYFKISELWSQCSCRHWHRLQEHLLGHSWHPMLPVPQHERDLEIIKNVSKIIWAKIFLEVWAKCCLSQGKDLEDNPDNKGPNNKAKVILVISHVVTIQWLRLELGALTRKGNPKPEKTQNVKYEILWIN